MSRGAGSSRMPDIGLGKRKSLVADQVILGPDLTVEAAESALDQIAASAAGDESVVIDLRSCQTFDVSALLLVLVASTNNLYPQPQTRFRLPTDPHARAYLRQGRFPSAVDHLTRMPFRLLVDASDETYFGEKSPPSRNPAADPSVDIWERLVRKRFFGFAAYELEDAATSAVLEAEWGRWRDPLVTCLLDRHLAGRGREVIRVVVQELLASVFSQSTGSVVVVATQMDLPAASAREAGYLTIAVWRNGDPHSVSRVDKSQGRSWPRRYSRSKSAGPIRIDIKAGGPIDSSLLANNVQSSQGGQDVDYALAAILPALDRGQRGGGVSEKSSSHDINDGFSSLCPVVTHEFGGNVELRSGRAVINVSRGSQGAFSYLVTAKELSTSPPGIMIVARVPISNRR